MSFAWWLVIGYLALLTLKIILVVFIWQYSKKIEQKAKAKIQETK